MTVYTDLDRRLGLQLREHLKIASKITRMDSDGTPVAMDYIHAAHELVAELRRLGWREPEPEQAPNTPEDHPMLGGSLSSG